MMRVNTFVLMFFVMSLSLTIGLFATPVETAAVEEKIAWGKETAGLVANLRALTPVVKPGEPLEFEILLKNVSQKEIQLLGYKTPSPATWVFNFGQ